VKNWTFDWPTEGVLVRNDALSRAMYEWILGYGIPYWYLADWWCDGCGRPQAGESPWPTGQKRCRTCGPGDGYVPCPEELR
jgi:hypothetical protein